MLTRLTVALVAGIVGALLGGVGGCLYAGNYAVDFEFLDHRGYEAGAAAGVFGGFVLAGAAGFLLARRVPSPTTSTGVLILALARILASILLLAVAGFCVFGFMATFEPLDPGAQLVGRIFYGAVGGACVAATVWILVARSRPAEG